MSSPTELIGRRKPWWDLDPLVGIAMGSKSDEKIMMNSARMLAKFKVPHELRVLSAHRTPDRVSLYGNSASQRGIKVIIAGAGGSAALPGNMASETLIPVLGVAVNENNKPLQAAIASQIEMPPGKPLAYMGENKAGAENAALEAVRILSLMDPELAEAYRQYNNDLAGMVGLTDVQVSQDWQTRLAETKGLTIPQA